MARLHTWWTGDPIGAKQTTSETLTIVVGILVVIGIPLAVIGALYDWFTMPSHAAYAALAVILLVYLGLFLLGLAALYVVVRVIRAAWRHGSGPAITEILRDEPLDRDA